ncbi:MAG: hypothetical protein PHG39_04570 [Acidithiobacillus ferrooxidans]|uniref:Uncharacterized protein n=1 Tax=Acidithiobacillus ferruginosus TaxID=3063951 RepID=A0ACD5IHP2_9PROT|nr:hypothetical protein [Acidithiobacillus ferrooxidans]MDD5002583.1 hypothetical protein [Acidithiobacillus sp.]MDD5377546.1 hypothetical protein [Acidithiobacillus sp.]MDD5575436.1 hypothetical protein [Acidithiobacillus sp.]
MHSPSPAQTETASLSRWPNFFITGTVKGGTTSLYRHLQKHPDVFLPVFKEPHYFAQIHPKPEREHFIEYVSDPREYLRLYDQASHFSALGDTST